MNVKYLLYIDTRNEAVHIHKDKVSYFECVEHDITLVIMDNGTKVNIKRNHLDFRKDLEAIK